MCSASYYKMDDMQNFIKFFFFFLIYGGLNPEPLYMLGKCSTMEILPPPTSLLLILF